MPQKQGEPAPGINQVAGSQIDDSGMAVVNPENSNESAASQVDAAVHLWRAAQPAAGDRVVARYRHLLPALANRCAALAGLGPQEARL